MSNKMRVLLANSSFGGGGVTTFAIQLISCLSADTELTVVLGDDKRAPITDPRVKVLYHDAKLLTTDNALLFINLINEVIKPDVVLCSAATIIPVIVPYLNDDIKVITFSHSGRFFYSKYCALNYQYLDRIIAASSTYNKNYIEECFHIKDKDKIKVIYNFVADDEKLERLRFAKKNQQPLRIVYAGQTSIHKSPEIVSKIVTKLLETNLDFRFFWTGNTRIPLTELRFKHSKFKDIKQLFPEDIRLVFPGRIPAKEDYDLLLGGANIFLAPSKNEGCSMATLEAHRAGSILIVADYENSNREIVTSGKSGFVVKHDDIDGFVEVISKIIKNHSEYFHFYEDSHDVFKTMLSYPVWKQKIFMALNSESNHKHRKKSVSKLLLWRDLIKMKWLDFSSSVERFLCFSLPCFFSFRKQYNEYKRKQANANRN